MCLDGNDFDFLLNDLLTKPDGFNGIVLAVRSELRRWSGCKNKCTQIVFVNSDVHSAGIGVVVIRILDTNGNANFINEGNDGQGLWHQLPKAMISASMVEVAVLVSSLDYQKIKDGASGNCNGIARATAHTNGVIVVLIAIETSKISIRVGINTKVAVGQYRNGKVMNTTDRQAGRTKYPGRVTRRGVGVPRLRKSTWQVRAGRSRLAKQ